MKPKYIFLLLIFSINISVAQKLKEGAVVVKLANQASVQDNFFSSSEAGRRNIVKFLHPTALKIFGNYVIGKCERTYPGVEKYDHPNAKILAQYYTIEGNFNRDKIIKDIIKSGNDLFEDVEPVPLATPSYVPNDYNLQTSPGIQKALDLVNAKGVWDLTKGSRSILAAVTDPRGFFLGHPDYVNLDNSNQMVYVDASATDQLYGFADAPSHGLEVASVLAISTDNNKGISGVGFNTSLMAFGGSVTQMVSAVFSHNAKIVEASWISSCTFQPSEQLAMNMIHDHGAVIVVAAGNGISGNSCPSSDGQANGLVYPASYDNVISVGGVDTYFPDSYTVANGANGHFTFNEAVDLTAPGWNVGVATVFFGRNSDGSLFFKDWDYNTASGTSFAAPMVAGVAGLILSLKPDLKPDGVEYILKSTSKYIDDLPAAEPSLPPNSIYQGKAGSGRLDAYAAVKKTYDCFACPGTVLLPSPLPPSIGGCQFEIQNATVNSGQTVEVIATRGIHVSGTFNAKSGSNLHLAISQDCSNIMSAGTSPAARSGTSPIQHIRYRDLIESGAIPVSDAAMDLEAVPETSSEPYPSPANTKITFRFNVSTPGQVQLSIFNVSGNKIDMPVNEYKTSGNYSITYDVSGLPAGIYYYSVDSIDGKKMQRFVIIR